MSGSVATSRLGRKHPDPKDTYEWCYDGGRNLENRAGINEPSDASTAVTVLRNIVEERCRRTH